MSKRLDIDQDALAALCRRHHIRRLSLFGSVLIWPASSRGVAEGISIAIRCCFSPAHTPWSSSSNLLEDRRNAYPPILWPQIVAMRNRLPCFVLSR
jgi:hypothetical protein